MRISIFSAFYPFRGGIAQFNARLFRALEKRNDVSAFTFTVQYPSFIFPGKTQFVAPEDKADTIPAQRIVNPFNPFTFFKAAKRIRKSSPDVFISNYWMTFFGICFGFLASRQQKSTKKIAIIHNLIPHEERFFDRFFTRYFLNRYDGFVVLSETVEKDLLRMKPTAQVKQIAHPWYDHFGEKIDKNEAKRALGLDLSKTTLLFFGLIRDYKGLDVLIDALDLLPDNFELIIAGEIYGKKEKYLRQIETAESSKRIMLRDEYISDDQVNIFFSAADACVLPYRTATQSGITAVSFHFEVPVVATNVGGLKETIESINAGEVVETVSPEAIAQGVERLFKGERHAQCHQNIKIARNHNSWDAFADHLVAFVDAVKAE